MDKYRDDFTSIMNSTKTYSKPGTGGELAGCVCSVALSWARPVLLTAAPGAIRAAFVHSCHTHCEAQWGAWNSIKVNGVSILQAVSKWWHSDGTDPAKDHTYTPCRYKTRPTGPRKCNPTC